MAAVWSPVKVAGRRRRCLENALARFYERLDRAFASFSQKALKNKRYGLVFNRCAVCVFFARMPECLS